jgi:predicted amidohydrolase
MTKIKIAAAQLTPAYLNISQTVDKARAAIAEAGNNGAGLIVFPKAIVIPPVSSFYQ